jgi:hypothetical protein
MKWQEGFSQVFRLLRFVTNEVELKWIFLSFSASKFATDEVALKWAFLEVFLLSPGNDNFTSAPLLSVTTIWGMRQP